MRNYGRAFVDPMLALECFFNLLESKLANGNIFTCESNFIHKGTSLEDDGITWDFFIN
jgi:hypothetical protein